MQQGNGERNRPTCQPQGALPAARQPLGAVSDPHDGEDRHERQDRQDIADAHVRHENRHEENENDEQEKKEPVALSAPDECKGDRQRKQRVQDTVEMLRGVIPALEKDPERQKQDLPDLFPVQERPVPEETVAPPLSASPAARNAAVSRPP